jgi:predicted permease
LPALLTGNVNGTSIFVSGRTYAPEQRDGINRMVVSPGFFDTLEIPIVVGRTLSTQDDEHAPKVALINQTAATKYFPHANPLGQRFGSSIEDSNQLEVVGVVRDVKYNSVRAPAPPTMYVPFRQTQPSRTVFTVRTTGDPLTVLGAIREAVRQVDQNIPLMDVTSQSDAIDTRLVQERLFARAYAVFGGTALLLASIGLFGLMSYSVSKRVNEIGIRMALGAQRSTIGQMVMRESLTLVVIGVIVGMVFATAAGRVVASQRYGLAPHDALTSTIAVVVMVLVSTVAAYLPARRASRVDPLAALQSE